MCPHASATAGGASIVHSRALASGRHRGKSSQDRSQLWVRMLEKLAKNQYQKIAGSRAIAQYLKVDGSNQSHSLRCSNNKRQGCHDVTIKPANMQGKETKKERWLAAMRSAYERVFAHRNRRVGSRGLQKVQF